MPPSPERDEALLQQVANRLRLRHRYNPTLVPARAEKGNPAVPMALVVSESDSDCAFSISVIRQPTTTKSLVRRALELRTMRYTQFKRREPRRLKSHHVYVFHGPTRITELIQKIREIDAPVKHTKLPALMDKLKSRFPACRVEVTPAPKTGRGEPVFGENVLILRMHPLSVAELIHLPYRDRWQLYVDVSDDADHVASHTQRALQEIVQEGLTTERLCSPEGDRIVRLLKQLDFAHTLYEKQTT